MEGDGMAASAGADLIEQAGRRSGEHAALIAEALRDQIISGALKAGEALRQERLASRFETSRMPVREALRILENEGFVVMAPNKGAVVAPLDAADMREIYEMRAVAEMLAMRLAIPEISNAQIMRAIEIQAQAEQSPIQDFGALNRKFHETLYSPCARPRLLAHINSLCDLADRYLRIAATSLGYTERSHREHRALLEAVEARDADRAARILNAHIMDAGEALHAFLVANAGLPG
jgi:DNA-binding GntR family transcriptional regulator